MGKSKSKEENQDPFTMIPNRVIRSRKLDAYDKLTFSIIASCNPSYPTYETIMKWSGMCRDRVWKSLKHLEDCNLIWRYKRGRAVEYVTYLNVVPAYLSETDRIKYRKSNGPSDRLFDAPLVCHTDDTSLPDRPISVRQTDAKKTKEKEPIKREFPDGKSREQGNVVSLNELMAKALARVT